MYEIKAKLIADRINISRGGARARRLPSIVLATGAVLRIAPGRSVRITEKVYEANKALLDSFAGMIDVIDRREISLPVSTSAVAEQKEKPKRRRSKPKPVLEPVSEPVLEPVLEPVSEPVPEPVSEPVSEPVLEPILEPVSDPALDLSGKDKPKRNRSKSRRKKNDNA